MTVDVEDYFHVSAFDRVVSRVVWAALESRVVANTERLLETVSIARAFARRFSCSGWVAERFPQLVREIAAGGHEIASHGFHHQLIYLLTPEQFREDVRRAKAAIEDAAGCTVARLPRAELLDRRVDSLWALDVLIEEGYSYDASIFPIHHDRYGIPDAPRHAHRIDAPGGSIVEVPVVDRARRLGATCRLPAAATSGCCRTRGRVGACSESTRSTASRWCSTSIPGKSIPNQPRLPVGRLTRLRHYRGLDKTLRPAGALGERLSRSIPYPVDADAASPSLQASVPAAARLASCPASGPCRKCRVANPCTSAISDAWDSVRRRHGPTARAITRGAGAACSTERLRPRIGLPDRARGRRAIAGVLPLVQIKSLLFGRTLTSLPFLNYGGVIADSDDAGTALVEARDGRGARAQVQPRGTAARRPARFPNLPCKQHKVAMRLPLARRASGTDSTARSATRFARRRSPDSWSSAAAPSCSPISTRCSRATCATSARRSIHAGSSKKCCAPSRSARNSTSCDSTASRSPPG